MWGVMKRISRLLTGLLLVATIFVVCRIDTHASILDTYFVTLNRGEDYQISLTDEDPADLEYSSSNPLIATVDADGLITATGKGSAFITVHSPSCTYYYRVSSVIPSITLSRNNAVIYKGGNCVDNIWLKSTVTGARKDVSWSSSDPSVAVVNSVGRVESVSEGSTTITATANGISASCDVEVVRVTTSLNNSILNVVTRGNNSVVTLKCATTGSSKTVAWKSSDATVATVNKNGTVTGKKTGRAIITATCNGVLASCVVNVSTTSLKFPTDIVSTPITPYEIPTYLIVPITSGITDTIVWTTSNPKVATVDSLGRVTFHEGGSATITAKANGVSDSHTFKVNRPSIKINSELVNLFTNGVNNKATLKASLIGDIKDANFISSDASKPLRSRCADVDKKTGLITGYNMGYCDIYAYIPGLVTESQIAEMVSSGVYFPSSINENYYKKCRVYVFETPTLSIRDTNRDGAVVSELSLTADYYRKSAQLYALIMGPSNKCVWKSSDESVVKVSKTGLVTAYKPGEAVVSVTANGKTNTCNVTVTKTLESGSPTISIDERPDFMIISGTLKTVPMNTSTILSRKLTATLSGESNIIKWYTHDTTRIVNVKNAVIKVNPKKMAGELHNYTTHVYAEANGVKDSVYVYVSRNAIVLDRNKLGLNLRGANTSYQLIPDISGRNDWGIKWTSSKPQIASVDESGNVTAHKKGKAVIKASLNGVTAKCNVKVFDNSLSIGESSKTIYYGGDATNNCVIAAKVVGADKEVIWESSDTDVAIVTPDRNYSNRCKVVSASVGDCVITARCNGQTASIPVSVLATDITLDKTSVALNTSTKGLNYNVKLTPTIVGSSKTVSWSTSDPAVATVNKKGVVTGKSTGICNIYAIANGITAQCTVNVTSTAIDIIENNLMLYAYDYETDGEYKIPLHETDAGLSAPVIWTSSDNRIATVDNDGVVTLLSHGNVVITASSSGVSDRCSIYNNMPVTALGSSDINLYYGTDIGNTSRLNVRVVGENKSVSYTSSDPSVATVENGLITATGAGDAVITVTANGIPAVCNIHVVNTELELVSDSMSLTKDYYNHSEQIVIDKNVGLTNAVKYSSTNTSVATVNKNGVVTATGVGSCDIKVSCNGIIRSCAVTVEETGDSAPTISLNKNDAILISNSKTKNTDTLTASVSGPDNNIVWSSSNKNIVNVEKGVITAIADGDAVITATANGVSDSCLVKVNKNKIVLDNTQIVLNLAGTNMSSTVGVTEIQGEYEPGTEVIWRSSDRKVADVDNNGRVRAIGAGDCKISASINGVATNCSVKVINNTITLSVKSIEFDISSGAGISKTISATVNGVSKSVIWESDKPEVASVSDTGIVTAHANGGAVIKATANGITAFCNVCVYGGDMPAHEHDYIITVTSQATCIEPGHQIKICRTCGEKVEEDIPATGHVLRDDIVLPTHIEQGYTKHTCICGYSEQSDYVPALGHTIIKSGESQSYNEVIAEASCDAAGIRRFYCECGYYEDESIEMLEHSPSSEWTVIKEPTETEPGIEAVLCEHCGAEISTRPVAVSTHTCVYVVTSYTAPTVDEAGTIEYCCYRCGRKDDIRSGSIPVLDIEGGDCEHDYEIVEVVYPASCNNYEICKVKCSLCEDEMIIVTGSEYDEDVHLFITTETTSSPTYNSDGSGIRKCEYCDYSEEIVIPKLTGCTHPYTKEIYSERHKYTVCLMCGETIGEPVELETCSHCLYATEQVVVSEATSTSEGLVRFICSTCGCIKDEVRIPAFTAYNIDKGNGISEEVLGYYDEEMADNLLAVINDYRLADGKAALTKNSNLDTASGIRAYEIASLYSHIRPNGSEWNSLNRRDMNAENIAVSYVTNADASDIIGMMKDDPGQNGNILNGEYVSASVRCFRRVIPSDKSGVYIPDIVSYYVVEFSFNR